MNERITYDLIEYYKKNLGFLYLLLFRNRLLVNGVVFLTIAVPVIFFLWIYSICAVRAAESPPIAVVLSTLAVLFFGFFFWVVLKVVFLVYHRRKKLTYEGSTENTLKIKKCLEYDKEVGKEVQKAIRFERENEIKRFLNKEKIAIEEIVKIRRELKEKSDEKHDFVFPAFLLTTVGILFHNFFAYFFNILRDRPNTDILYAFIFLVLFLLSIVIIYYLVISFKDLFSEPLKKTVYLTHIF